MVNIGTITVIILCKQVSTFDRGRGYIRKSFWSNVWNEEIYDKYGNYFGRCRREEKRKKSTSSGKKKKYDCWHKPEGNSASHCRVSEILRFAFWAWIFEIKLYALVLCRETATETDGYEFEPLAPLRSKSTDLFKLPKTLSPTDNIKNHFNTLKNWSKTKLKLMNKSSSSDSCRPSFQGCDIVDDVCIYETISSGNRKRREKERKPSTSSSAISIPVSTSSIATSIAVSIAYLFFFFLMKIHSKSGKNVNIVWILGKTSRKFIAKKTSKKRNE